MTTNKDLKTLFALPDEVYGAYLLEEDVQNKKYIDEKDLISRSIECGLSFAKTYKGQTVEDLLKKFDLEISRDEGSTSLSYYELAYFEEPNRIVLCDNNINLVKDKAQEIKELRNINVEDIIISHEIFHKIEEIHPDIYTNKVQVLLFKIGPIKKYKKIKAASEIGAMAFSKELLGLDFNPLIVSYLLALACGKEKVIYEKISRSKNES